MGYAKITNLKTGEVLYDSDINLDHESLIHELPPEAINWLSEMDYLIESCPEELNKKLFTKMRESALATAIGFLWERDRINKKFPNCGMTYYGERI